MSEQILSGILAYYGFPDETFVGSPESVDALKQALDRRNDWRQSEENWCVGWLFRAWNNSWELHVLNK